MFYQMTNSEHNNVIKHVKKRLKQLCLKRDKHVLYEIYKINDNIYTFNTYKNTPKKLIWLDAGEIKINFKERTQKRQVLRFEIRQIYG